MCASVLAAGVGLVVLASLAACTTGEVGDEPIERCVPEGACDGAMFRGGLSAQYGDPTRGAAIYLKECARCHGAAGKGLAEARRVDMTSPAWQASMRDGTIVSMLRTGRLPTMPAFALADQELRDLLAHLRRLELSPVAPARKGY